MVGKQVSCRSKSRKKIYLIAGEKTLRNALQEAEEKLDPEIVKSMKKYLNDLTTSGSPSLDETIMKQFKQLCRKSDENINFAFLVIMQQLQKNHSEIRLSAFQVANELFQRSHAFRQSLITHLQEFLTLTTETESGHQLPPPKAAATRLKTDVLRTVHQWHENFGKAYRKLAVGYDYLKNCKHVDFDNIRTQNLAEQKRIEEEEEKKKKMMAKRLEKVLQDITENREEIQNCLKEADNCLKLILPSPLDFNLQPYVNDDNSNSATSKTKNFKVCNNPDHVTVRKENHESIHCDNTFQMSNPETSSLSQSSANDDVWHSRKQEKLVKKDENHYYKDSVSVEMSSFTQLNSKHGKEESNYCKRDMEKASSDEECKLHINPLSPANSTTNKKNCFNGIENDKEDDDDVLEDNDNDDDADIDDGLDLQVHGLQKPGFSLTIEVPAEDIAIKETEDNTAIMQSLKDSNKLIAGSFIPKVSRWLEILSKNGAKEQDIKAMIDLKVELESINKKCLDLDLIVEKKTTDETDSDEEDLEDVPEKEGYEQGVAEHLTKPFASTQTDTSSLLKRKLESDISFTASTSQSCDQKKMTKDRFWSLKERETMGSTSDPTSRATALALINPEKKDQELETAASTSQEEKSSNIPFVPFGKDLAHWENPDEMEAPSIVKYDSLHRFWTPAEKESEKASDYDKAAMQYRVFQFTGSYEPVKWKCRVPMQNGKLCERMDRVKCPFHGKIIARNKDGKPNAISDSGSKDSIACPGPSKPIESDSTGEGELQPWKDPELQREIEAATGLDLGSSRSQKLLEKTKKGKGKGKNRKKDFGGLTNIKATANTVRKRLEKRVFNRGSMKKVCARLDSADYRRVRDKFGNQFNYSLH